MGAGAGAGEDSGTIACVGAGAGSGAGAGAGAVALSCGHQTLEGKRVLSEGHKPKGVSAVSPWCALAVSFRSSFSILSSSETQIKLDYRLY